MENHPTIGKSANHWLYISLRLSREPYIVEQNGCHFWGHLTTSWMLMLDTSHYTEIMKIVLYITLYVRLFQLLENHPTIDWASQPLRKKVILDMENDPTIEKRCNKTFGHPTMVYKGFFNSWKIIQPLTELANHWQDDSF